VEAQPDTPGADFPARPAGSEPSVPRQLPDGLTGAERFVGRDAELAALTAQLEQARTGGTAAISGTAGVGKTALAVHWARQVATQFPDGQLYVNLRGADPSRAPMDPAEALTTFLHALGVAPDQIPGSPDAQAALYQGLLAGKRLLLVLDDAADEEQVRPLLPAGPGCVAIVTSRGHLAGLADVGARMLTLDVLSEPEARDLIAAGLGPERLAADPQAAAELTSLCARLPLALAIAAAQARARPRLALALLAGELRDASAGLATPEAGDPAQNVRSVLAWSQANLTPAAAEMFRLLGLHPGPEIGVPAAASLAGSSVPRARELLGELADRRLVTEPMAGRYVLHDALRAYAAEQAAAMDDPAARHAALARILDHYLHTAYAAALLVTPAREAIALAPAAANVAPERLADHREALDWFEAEQHPLLSAVAVAADAGFGVHAWQIAWTLTDFLEWRGLWLDMAAISRIALAAATRLGDVTGQAIVSRLVAYTNARAGDYDQARALLNDCLVLCRQAGRQGLEARVYQTLGWVCVQQDRYFDALGHAEESLAVFRAIGDRDGEARALNNVGYCHLLLGDRRLGRNFCEQAVLMHREEGYVHGEAIALDSLGEAEHQLGRDAVAVECYERALRLFRDLADRHAEARTLVHLGDAHSAAGDPVQARDAWQQSLAILEDLRHPNASQVRRKLSVTPG